MSIQDFTNYVAGNKYFFIDLHLRNTTLVIEGNSLYRRLYLVPRCDHQHGGDYDSFAKRVRQFFETLFLCNIRPYVVLDGSMGHTDKKFNILKQRAQTNITAAHALSTGSRGTILPILGKTVFRQVLSELQVPFVQCLAEASREIASLANQWNCPVLTMESIFYTFDLKIGCIPTNNFFWDNVKVGKKTSEKHIEARLFSLNRLCMHFNHMNKDLMPLFASMVGYTAKASCDYTNFKRIMETFFIHANFPEGPRNSKNRTHDRIESLLRWMSQFTGPEEALKAMLEVLGGAHSENDVYSLLSSGLKIYSLTASNLIPFFTEGAPLSSLPDPIRALPTWILLALAKGQMGFFILNVLMLQKVMLYSQVEDFQLPCCNMTSRPIRQVLYSLLLNGKQREKQIDSPMDERVNLCSTYSVQEFGRQGLFLEPASVKAEQPKTLLCLPLESLDKVWVQVRLEVLLETLEVKPSLLRLVPSDLHLPVCVTRYWLTHAEPRPDLQHLQALLLGFVFAHISGLHSCRYYDTGFADAGQGKWCRQLAVVWKRLNGLRVKRRREGPDPGAAHTFCQWQSCLRMSLLLNQLLCFPLPEPKCAWLYRGTLAHRLVKEMKEGRAPEDLLRGHHLPGKLFRDLMQAVQSSVGAGFFRKKRRKTALRQVQKQQHAESPQFTEDNSNSSTQLEGDSDSENEDDYDDDDSNDDDQEEKEQCWEPVGPVRVRFRTTCRTNQTRVRVRLRKPDRVLW